MKGIQLIIEREWRLAWRHPAEILNPLIFIILMVCLFPLAMQPESTLLKQMGPAVIWVAALLAHLFAAERLFRDDWLDGSLEQYFLLPIPFVQIIIGKLLFHWLTVSVPVMMISPVLGLFYSLPPSTLWVLMISLLLGTPALALFSAVGASLVVSLRQRGLLLMLLVIPWYIPILIFGASGIIATDPAVLTSSWALLGAILIVISVLAPLIIVAALTIGMTE